MILKDGMLLYHGSYIAVEAIDLNKCSDGKDFGKGFYLSDNNEQAKGFIITSLKKAINLGQVPVNQNYGYVSIFRYHNPKETNVIYEFETTDREWLWFVSMNRRSCLANRFQKKLDRKLSNAEIVVGKIANDTTNPTIMAYLNGLYGDIESNSAVNFAIAQLMPDRLRNQYCFLSQKAVDCLELVEVIRYEQ